MPIQCLLILMCGALTVLGADEQFSRSRVLKVLEAARKGPVTARQFALVKQVLPRLGGYYLVEGDIRMTEQELRTWLDKQSRGPRPPHGGELLVALRPDGARDFYEIPELRTLTYAIRKQDFTSVEYDAVVLAMADAAGAWESACPACEIHYVHHPELDDGTGEVTFRVRKVDSHGAYVAMSFFPSDAPARKTVDIDPIAFGLHQPDLSGVLRHELGHTLGYRHEHIQGVAGCGVEGGTWQPLTSYDPRSVMHYFCGGGGNLKLELSSSDIDGHRRLYGRYPSASAPTKLKLVVDFDGGLVANDIVAVLQILQRRGLLSANAYHLKPGESIPDVYTRTLRVPWSPTELNDLADSVNNGRTINEGRVAGPNITKQTVRIDDVIWLPNVRIETYPFTKRFDRRRDSDRVQLESVQKHQRFLLLDQPQGVNDTVVKVELRGYRLILPEVDDGQGEGLKDATQEILSLNRLSVQPMLIAAPRETKRVFFSAPVTIGERHTPDVKALGDLIGLPQTMPPTAACSAIAPHIVLLDQPVFNHPNLGDSVDHAVGEAKKASTRNFALPAFTGEFKREVDHGTHLAGILVGKPLGSGIIGIHPGDKLSTLDWSALFGKPELRDALQNMDYGSRAPIYLFASQWDMDGPTGRPIVKRMKDLRNIWVVAAGQSEDGTGTNKPISESSPAPMSLGKEPYIIVVTACEDCYGPTARLQRWANFSDQFVQIAAPGEDVLSTVSGGLYARARGTSQAAAFVAGLVSLAMQAHCERGQFPYDRPERIKAWLQLTSRPNLWNAERTKLMPFGVLDGKAAMLNPQLNYTLRPNGEAAQSEYEEIKNVRWCRSSIELWNEDEERLRIVNTADVRRIVKQGSEWFVYELRDTDLNGDVNRIGPGHLRDSAAVLSTSAGVYNLNQVTDIILGRGVPQSTSCPVK